MVGVVVDVVWCFGHTPGVCSEWWVFWWVWFGVSGKHLVCDLVHKCLVCALMGVAWCFRQTPGVCLD